MKHKQAVKAVAECMCEWVEFGKTVRTLSLAESISKRARQAIEHEPLPLAELHGVRTAGIDCHFDLVAQANRLCSA